MKLSKIISLISMIFFLGLTFLIIFYPSIASKNETFNGEVTSVWKTAPPRPRWIVEVRENENIKKINYPFINDVITIKKGDSIRKEKGSKVFSIKKENTKDWVLID